MDVKCVELCNGVDPRGSRANWPAVRRERVALVEGGPDALAGFHFALSGGGENETGIVSMLGAGCRIPQECLTDLPVRVFVHDDEPGLKAARRWAGQLAGAGARVSVSARVNLYMAAMAPLLGFQFRRRKLACSMRSALIRTFGDSRSTMKI